MPQAQFFSLLQWQCNDRVAARLQGNCSWGGLVSRSLPCGLDRFPFDHLDPTKLTPEELVPLQVVGHHGYSVGGEDIAGQGGGENGSNPRCTQTCGCERERQNNRDKPVGEQSDNFPRRGIKSFYSEHQ